MNYPVCFQKIHRSETLASLSACFCLVQGSERCNSSRSHIYGHSSNWVGSLQTHVMPKVPLAFTKSHSRSVLFIFPDSYFDPHSSLPIHIRTLSSIHIYMFLFCDLKFYKLGKIQCWTLKFTLKIRILIFVNRP